MALLDAVLNSPRDLVVLALDRQYRYLAFNDAHRQTMAEIWGRDIEVGVDRSACAPFAPACRWCSSPATTSAMPAPPSRVPRAGFAKPFTGPSLIDALRTALGESA